MPTQTRLVIEDYILHKIQTKCSSNSNGLSQLKDSFTSLQNPSPLKKAVRSMVDRYSHEQEDYFSRIFENVIITSDLDVATQLSAVAKNMFNLPLQPVESKNNSNFPDETTLDDSHINWGQIIMLIVFASNFAVKAVECNELQKVDDIIIWLTHFFESDLSFWLAKQGGWNDFYHWSKTTNGHRDTCGSTTGPSSGFQKAMGVGVVAACAGLLFMITQK